MSRRNWTYQTGPTRRYATLGTRIDTLLKKVSILMLSIFEWYRYQDAGMVLSIFLLLHFLCFARRVLEKFNISFKKFSQIFKILIGDIEVISGAIF